MKQIRLVLSLWCTLASCMCISHATNYHVSMNGNDNNDGLSLSKSLRTIQAATDRVRAGDSVLVYNGNYTGFDHRDKENGQSGKPIVYFAKGNQVVISTGYYRNNGINIENNDYIHIVGFKIKKMIREGIRAVYANHITIRLNECDSCYRGIFTGYTDDILVEQNICTRSHGEHGIYISNNSDRAVVRHNSCSYNKASGIQFNPDLSSGAPGYSEDAVITHNIVFENKRGAGLNLQGLSRAIVANNLIYNNHEASGITLFHGDASKGCTDVRVYHNTILVPSDGRWGIHIIDDAERIELLNNVILNLHAWKGAIALQKNSYIQKNISSDFNYVSDKFCETDDGCSKSLAFWQSLGYDLHSLKATDPLNAVFQNISMNDFRPVDNSPLIDAGSNAVSTVITDDLNSLARPQGKGFDPGSFEKQAISGSTDPIRLDKKSRELLLGAAAMQAKIVSHPRSSWSLLDMNGQTVQRGGPENEIPFCPSGIFLLSILPDSEVTPTLYFVVIP